MSKRSFKSFLAGEGIDGVKSVATLYATENDDVTFSSISNSYNITEYGVRQLVEYAIVNCIISYQTACLIKQKAHRNQARHLKTCRTFTASDNYYDYLLSQRISTIKSFSDEKIKELANIYINSSNLLADEIAKSAGLSKYELNMVLKKAIILDIVENSVAANLYTIAINKADSGETYFVSKALNDYMKIRKSYKFLKSKKAELLFKLESLDDFASYDEALYLKESAEKELEEIEKSINAVNSF